ncbi:hypothetical protein HPHPP4_1154 [Helicobacter pylori Hp P-4]|uniref:Uncharacterized protein n=1 Tax=Helicobacter pylori Hp P-4 TaxID=992075 RepID=J0PUN7_HELPX|nr:hypothetical protein [Helicobacter pylori]EJC02351.1 hypothetical protein HPHPP4_1154 [Helicobacter pylori Hp P-4]
MAFYHSIILSFYHSIILSFYHSIILSFYHSIILSFYHSIILSFYHSIKQSNNQTTLPYFYNFLSFYKNLFKNPLLFIIPPFILPFINPFIPPFINPRYNIFKPFDSISLIFKPVGLTELNSIQGEDNGSVRRFESA